MRRKIYVIKKDSAQQTLEDKLDECLFVGNGEIFWMFFEGKLYEAELIQAGDNFYFKTLPDKEGNYFLSYIFSEL